jgi:hypothetical protein
LDKKELEEDKMKMSKVVLMNRVRVPNNGDPNASRIWKPGKVEFSKRAM